MTLEQFYKELKKTKKTMKWSFDECGCNELRAETGLGSFCPITAVCLEKTNLIYGTPFFHIAARFLKLGERVAENIASAADGEVLTPTQTKILKRMKKILL